MTTITETLSEVRSILDPKQDVPSDLQTVIEASEENYAAAALYIDQGAGGGLRKMIDKKLDGVDAAFKKAKKRMSGLKKAGAGRTEGVTLLKPVLVELRKVHQFLGKAIDTASKDTGLQEGVEFTNQGNGLWEDPVMGYDKPYATKTPGNSQGSSQSANMSKSVNALMNATKGQVVKMGKVAYKVAQSAQAVGKNGHVIVLSGASGGGKGDQYLALIPPTGDSGGTVKLVNIGSAVPMFRDLTTDLTVEDGVGDGEYPVIEGMVWASPRVDETMVWVEADEDHIAPIIRAVFKGDELSYHLESVDGEPGFVTALRGVIGEGIAEEVDGIQVSVCEAARVVQVYDGLGAGNQQKAESMGLRQMIDVVDKMSDAKQFKTVTTAPKGER